MSRPVISDLTQLELADLIAMKPKGVRYHWIRCSGETIHKVSLKHDGQRLTCLDFEGSAVPRPLVRAIYASLCRRRAKRKEAAKRAAETRRRRKELKVRKLAEAIVRGERLGPAPVCRICSKKVTDPQSIERGIGSECWQGLMRACQVVREASRR